MLPNPSATAPMASTVWSPDSDNATLVSLDAPGSVAKAPSGTGSGYAVHEAGSEKAAWCPEQLQLLMLPIPSTTSPMASTIWIPDRDNARHNPLEAQGVNDDDHNRNAWMRFCDAMHEASRTT